MNIKRRQISFSIMLLTLLTLLVTTFTLTALADGEENPLHAILEKIENAEQYTFDVTSQQTLIPRASATTIGQTNEQLNAYISGNVTGPQQIDLALRIQGMGVNAPPMQLQQDGANLYVLEDGERTLLQAAPTALSGMQNPSAFLASAVNLQPLVTTQAAHAYTFDIDGSRYAAHLAQQASANTPANQHVAPAAQLQNLTGTGEIWLDANGWITRQILDLHIPNVNGDYDMQAHTVIDFTFDPDVITAWNAPNTQSGITNWVANTATPSTGLNLSLVLIAFIFVIALLSNKRTVRRGIPVALTLVMIVTPILQAAAYTQPEIETVDFANAFNTHVTNTQAEAPAPAVESPLSLANETIADYAPDLACGDSSESIDSDLDGLNDFVELCLGTDPFSADTDIDNVSDKLEVDGFLIDGVRWYSNPLQPDSNRDGLQDLSEWEAPLGSAASMDVDGDGVPNLWDRDNDGDNVPDDVDLSPLSATDYRTSFAYESSKGQQAFDGYQYVEFQIQPENSNHLLYSNAPLDWPNGDVVGTITQLNSSTEDLTLIPFLRLETYPLPDETLLDQYNISYVEQWDGTYSLHVPLTNITDGGNIVAFHAKLVFNPEMLDNIELDNMELVWFVVAEIDSLGETQTEIGLTLPIIEENPKVVDVFVDDYRISGMTVTLSDDVSLAWFGTPNTPNDNRDLFNLLFGMNKAFLEHQNPDLQTVVDRFTSDTTPDTKTWGLSATDVEVISTSTEHIDAAIPYASSALPTFFSDNGYPMTDFTSLVMASEQSIGWHNLDELSETERASGKLTSNLTDIDLNVARHLSLVGYEFQSGWQSLSTQETLLKAQERYDDVSAELTTLQSDYPDLTADELKTVIHLLYASWLAGRLSIIETGGLPIVDATADDDAITAEYQLINTPNLIIYLVKSLGLAKEGGGFALTTTSDRYRYIRQDESAVITYSAAASTGFIVGLIGEDGYEASVHSIFLAWGLVYIKTANTALKSSFIFTAATKLAKVYLVVTAIITVGLLIYSWYNYFTSVQNTTNGYERDVLLSYALMYTLVTVLFFAIAVSGIGAALVGIIYLLDLILWLCCDIALMEEFYSIVASIGDLTVLNDMTFAGASVSVPGESGPRVGGTMILSDRFTGEMTAELAEGKVDGQGTSGDLMFSFTYAYYTGNSTSGYDFSTNSTIEENIADSTNYVYHNCHLHNNYLVDEGSDKRRETQHCINTPKATFTFNEPSTGMKLSANVNVWVQRQQWVCQITSNCFPTTTTLQLPDDMQAKDQWEPFEIVVDVLPGTLDDLWNWSALGNNDKDGDGILSHYEAKRGSSDSNPDSDNDGLNDRLEVTLYKEYGFLLTDADSDDDGLLDGIEYQLQLVGNDPDSDDDLLTDGQEWPSIDTVNGTWSGGGWFVTIAGNDYWVFSDPFDPDWDQDGLNDASEKANGSSPYGYNDAPRLSLSSAEKTVSPTGAAAIYLGPNAAITAQLDLLSTGAVEVADLLALCFPAGLTPTGVTPSGDSVPMTVINGSCYEWDFSSEALTVGETFAVAISAETTGASSQTDLIATLQHPIDGVTSAISVAIPIVVDTDLPTLAITDPISDTLLGGGTTHYVIGGDAADATTWIDHVDITTPSGVFTATGTARWAYTWELPADGVYTISAQATDYLGNLSATDTKEVTVDNTAPAASVALNSLTTAGPTTSTAITVTMQGSASDNLSGLAWIKMSLNGRPWRAVWESDSYPTTANWSGSWVMANSVEAQGEHDVRVIAMDKAGNLSNIFEGTILVDLLAPTAELTNRAFLADPPSVQPNQALNLYGVANDAGNNPVPSTPSQLAGTLDSLGDATTLLQLSSLIDDDSGVTLTWLGDINGDRLADLAVGLPAAADGAGQVIIVNGRGGDWTIPRLGESGYLEASNSIFTGVDGAGIGAVVAPAGDINGDGLSDFLIGDAANNRVYLIRGRIGNYGTESLLDGAVDYLRQEFLPPAGMTIGNAVAAAGDVNGDNVDDFLIGATSATTGSVYLFLGDVQTTVSIPLDEAAGAIIATSSAGASIASVGDVNDDHIDDFAVGFGGQVYLFEGAQIYANGGLVALDSTDADHTFTSADSQPTIVRFNDLNGDIIDDFGYTDGTTPQVVLGNSTETYTPQALNFAPAASGTLVAGGDVNRNGNADILVINAADDLYIIDGSNLGAVAATIENVRIVASAPYARGADLNADDASDIAVMPFDGAAILGMDTVATAVNPTWLPKASSVLPPFNNSGEVYVDDDYCSSCANDGHTWSSDAFDNIQSALDASGMGDMVVVNPGQYAPFTVSNDDVTISGVNADAVFIDGGGANEAVVINNADGVRLQQLTIRNAGTLLTLNDAGQFGWQDTAEQTILSRVLLQDYTTHAVWMTDDSTLQASDVTIVGTQNHIEVDNDGSETDPANTQIVSDTRAAVGVSGGIATNDYLLYLAHEDGATDTLYEYALNTGTWHNRGFAANSGGIITGTVYAAQEYSEGLNKNGFVVLRPAGEGYNGSISRINSGEGVWTRLDLGSWTDEFSEGLAAAYGSVYQLYILSGQTNNKFYRFDTAFYNPFSLNEFTELAAPPATVGTGSALLVYGSGTNSAYALLGGGSKTLCEWTAVDFADTGSWDCSLAQLPEAPSAGSALVSDGENYWDNTGYFYAVIGGGSTKWYRYSINDDSWTAMPDLPLAINEGGGMVRDGDYFYFIGGGGSDAVWRYGRARASGFTKLTLNNVAVVTGDEATSAEWFNQSDQPDHFTLSTSNLALVGGDSTVWTPTVGTVYSHTLASFSDVAQGVYRLTNQGPLTAGYHDYAPRATVSADGVNSGSTFSSIQSAINSGANEVVIETGAFSESFYMLSGITLVGEAADLTSIELPAGDNANALVGMEGVRGATIANVKLIGDGSVIGIDADGQLQDALLSRSIAQNFGTAVAISDLNSQLTLVNNTILDNSIGVAATNCGSINARNNVIAYNQTLGLSYEECAATKLHTYNLYWANGLDLSPNNPGAAELFLDPLYSNLANGDFSTATFSPIINSGDPGDSAPPGAGSRVDIGHLEQNGASFYVDDDYCQTCNNDGLIWQVNAFDKIQDAIDTVEAIQTSLTTGEVVPFTIGVAPGIYEERLTIRSPITLLGSGADQTILQVRQTNMDVDGGNLITFDGATQAGVEEFQIYGRPFNRSTGILVMGNSNNITIQRNLIVDHGNTGQGIKFEDRGSGVVKFNTIIHSGVAVQANDDWAVVQATNNIFDNNLRSFEANGTPIGGIINSDYNLSRNGSGLHYTRVDQGANDIVDVDPQFVDTTHYMIQVTSPAIDAADPGEPVSLGGGLIADIGYHEYEDQTIAVSILMGELDASRVTANIGVQAVEYGVVPVVDSASPVTATLPLAWTNAALSLPNESLTYWNASYTPTTEGYYRIYSRATDVSGNTEDDKIDWYDGAFIVDDTDPTVTWLSPADGSSFGTGFVSLQAQTADYIGNEFNVGSIAFEINGTSYPATWSSANWTADGSTPRTFILYTDVISTGLPIGTYSAKAVVVDEAGNSAETSPIAFNVTGVGTADTIAPTLTITSHVSGDIVDEYETIIAGTGSDAESGIQSYAVSLDGGITWRDAIDTGSGFIYTWLIGAEQGATYPVRVRAIDWAGNITVEALSLSVDTVPPSDLAPFTFSVPPGSHTDEPISMITSWITPTDSSGTSQVYVRRGESPGAVANPTYPVNDTSYSFNFYPEGDSNIFYVGIAVEDLSGNRLHYTFGPWYIGTVRAGGWSTDWNYQTIEPDGVTGIANSEWLTETELLDVDTNTTYGPQTLYTAWSSTGSMLAWDGVDWSSAGTLWAYYDLYDGVGSSQPISLTGQLPFSADYAISFDGSNALEWQFDGANWVFQGIYDWGYDAQSLEIGTGFFWGNTGDYDQHRMLVFGVDDNDDVWSAFPLLNDKDSQFEHYFDWNISQGEDLLELPVGARIPQAQLSVSSAPGAQTQLGESNNVSYQASVTNFGSTPIDGVQLTFSGTAGLSYSTVSGATCVSCVGSEWLVDLPQIAIGATQVVTVAGSTVADLTSIDTVSTTITLSSQTVSLVQEAVEHVVDITAPTGAFDQAPGDVVNDTQPIISGSADDGVGVGVTLVEVRVDGGDWQDAAGTNYWSASTAPGAGATMLVEARITDYLGYSAIIAQTFVLDSAPPTTTLTIPAYISGTNGISGIAIDPAPANAQVETVDVQLDDENEGWQSATIDPANPDDSRDWMFNVFGGGDGITRAFRVRVTDYADNVTTMGWETAVIDTIAPDLIVTYYASEVSNTGADLALQGTVTDGSGVNHVTVIVYPDVGTPTYIDITPAGEDWIYQPNLTTGVYNLYVQAEDSAGNQVLQGPFDLTVLDKRLLTVTPAGNGTGTVTSNPVGIDCGADCTELVDPGTVVTLTAIADTGSTFTGWSGDCVGTGSCLLTMTETKHVTATFTTYTTATLPLSPSWNLIGLPVQPLTPLTAQGLLDMVNSQGNTCTEIARWHNGGWDSHIDGMPFNNFTIEMGHGYFVECTGFGSWDLPGTTLSSSVALSIQASWNLIAIPYSSGYTAQTLLDALNSQGNTCTEVDRWQSGGWDSHIDGLPFNDFTIEVDEGYFVSCSSGGSFTP